MIVRDILRFRSRRGGTKTLPPHQAVSQSALPATPGLQARRARSRLAGSRGDIISTKSWGVHLHRTRPHQEDLMDDPVGPTG